ncbi:Hypothetical protein FKW44_004814, partial [Caligus rogercresseyi]
SEPHVLWNIVHSGEKGVKQVLAISGDSKKKLLQPWASYLRNKYLPLLSPPLGVSKLY